MKRLLYLAIFLILLGGCKKDDSGNSPNPCGTPGVTLNTGTGSVEIYLGSGDYGFYEIEYGPNGFTRGTGTTLTVSNYYTLTNLTNGTYDLYARGNCGGTSYSDWSSAKSFLIQGGQSSTCIAPSNLRMSPSFQNYELYWDHSYSSTGYYEVEYGPTGFSLGNGTRKTVNSTSYSGGSFTGGTTYDFYVRGNCGGSDFSPWAGPASFYADHSANQCLAPTNLTAQRSGAYIDYSFNANGEDNFELVVNNSPSTGGNILQLGSSTSGSVGTFYSNVTYYMYVRAICNDGNRTAWTGPYVIN